MRCPECRKFSLFNIWDTRIKDKKKMNLPTKKALAEKLEEFTEKECKMIIRK
jgi:hypothetical protein